MGSKYWRPGPCKCGSGRPGMPQYDKDNNFLCFTCEYCHDDKVAVSKSEVLTDPNYFSIEDKQH